MNSLIYILSKLIKKSRLSSVKSSYIHKSSKIESGSQFYFSKIDKYSFCGYDCDISYTEIGKYVSIANRVIIGGGRHPMEWVGMSPVFYDNKDSIKKKFSMHKREDSKKISIANDVWIGQSSIILPGLKIGNGVVVGAGSVVTKDVPDYAIVVGNPAKIIKYRFEKNTISKLLEINWWDFDDKKLQNYAKYFNDVDMFIDQYSKNER
tara:strand:- start:2061 stop:2681 length:621 start_codon:yes stop_codon:yes gene_type:complete